MKGERKKLRGDLLIALAILVMLALNVGERAVRGALFPRTYAPIATVESGNAIYLDGKALIRINTASRDMLMMLPGIGEVLSARIIGYIEEHGPFSACDELDAVDGIGPATIEKLRDKISFE